VFEPMPGFISICSWSSCAKLLCTYAESGFSPMASLSSEISPSQSPLQA
jgi:hypothetical protein